MKFRNGFVSNSSSSSFAVWGAFIRVGDYDEYETISEGLPRGFASHYIDGGDVVVGLHAGKVFDFMQQSETKDQVLARIRAILREATGQDLDVEYHEGEYPC